MAISQETPGVAQPMPEMALVAEAEGPKRRTSLRRRIGQPKSFAARVVLAAILVGFALLFLYPFAVSFNRLGLFALVEMVLFMLTVFIAYAYVWRRGGLNWE